MQNTTHCSDIFTLTRHREYRYPYGVFTLRETEKMATVAKGISDSVHYEHLHSDSVQGIFIIGLGSVGVNAPLQWMDI